VKNTRRIFGVAPDGWEVDRPEMVVTVGLAYDAYKKAMVPKLWRECYKKIKAQMPLVNPDLDFFWSEITAFNNEGSILFERRYFTPAENRRKLK